jgi:hypothetical protein
VRRALYALFFATMIVAGFGTELLRVFFLDREAQAASLAVGPDRAAPGYAAFLREVRARTPEGARVALVVPMRSWSGGYEYAYYRASYFLTSREVIPLVEPDGSAHLDRVAGATHVAVWGMAPRVPGFEAQWSGSGGALLRRSE